MTFADLLFGRFVFSEGQEYRKFRHRFACVLILVSIFVTGLFIAAALAGAARLHPAYLWSGAVYCVLNVGALVVLRSCPARLPVIAAFCIAASFLLEAIAFFSNTEDEMRIIWFALSVPAAYLIVGNGGGMLLSVVSIIFVIIGNSHLAAPYSTNAVITTVVAILYISVFFRFFAAKSISFHHAMVEANRMLAEMASRDPLTGLFNARAYYALCDNALHQAQRSGRPFAMLFIDLDHFKAINDRYGHEAGDSVLRAVAICLGDGVRQSDVVGRIGGEEFSALLPDTDRDGALQLAETLRRQIEELDPDIGTMRLPITASIGVTIGRADLETIAEVQHRADEAMYEAKRGGRNRVSALDGVIPAREASAE